MPFATLGALFSLSAASPPALWLLRPTCTHLPVLSLSLYSHVASPLVFSSYQHNTTTISPLLPKCSAFGAVFCLDPASTAQHVTPLPSPLNLRQDLAMLLACCPAWASLSTRDNNFLGFCVPQCHGCYQMQNSEEAMLSLCSSGLEHFYYHCLEVTRELIY